MGSIFDGIQRPLKGIADLTESIYIPKGEKMVFGNNTSVWMASGDFNYFKNLLKEIEFFLYLSF